MNMFRAWYVPFYYYGVIHGDPHLGNYTLTPDGNVNLLDFGCIRVFPPEFVKGVIDLYWALRRDDPELAVEAYRIWGFTKLSKELLAALNVWAAFLYEPLLEDKPQRILSDGGSMRGARVAGTGAQRTAPPGRCHAAARVRPDGPGGYWPGLGLHAPEGRD